MRPLVARCHLALGKLKRRLRKRGDAQDHLTTASALCREMGMRFGSSRRRRKWDEASRRTSASPGFTGGIHKAGTIQ